MAQSVSFSDAQANVQLVDCYTVHPLSTSAKVLTKRCAPDPEPVLEDGAYVMVDFGLSFPLDNFAIDGDEVQLFANCDHLSGCDFYGVWADPFIHDDGYITYITSTVITEYLFEPQADGTIEVFRSIDQCYPLGCSDPPLESIGFAEPAP